MRACMEGGKVGVRVEAGKVCRRGQRGYECVKFLSTLYSLLGSAQPLTVQECFRTWKLGGKCFLSLLALSSSSLGKTMTLQSGAP